MVVRISDKTQNYSKVTKLLVKPKVYSESRSLNITGDSFPKIIVRRDIRKRFYDENGILNIGLIDFLLSDNVL